jgi:hypothetical protein
VDGKINREEIEETKKISTNNIATYYNNNIKEERANLHAQHVEDESWKECKNEETVIIEKRLIL